MIGIFITFLLFVFTRLILFRSGIEEGSIADINAVPTPIPIKLNPPKVKNHTHTPVKGKTKSNLPKNPASKNFLLLCMLDESIDSNLTIKTIEHQ